MARLPALPLAALLAGPLAGPALAQDFPVTLDGEFGPITLDEAPTRIVVVGVHEQDFLYQLGIAPVGVHEWFGERPYATWPWADAAREAVGAAPEVQAGWEINPEWVASLDPDLIVATYWGEMTPELYGLLGRIAPVLSPPPGTEPWGIAWEEELRLLARATGTTARADEIVADLDARFARARAAHPDLAGLTGGAGYVYDNQTQVFPTSDITHQFLARLGLAIPPEFDALSGEAGHFDLSPENLDTIDLDVFLFPEEPVEGSAFEATPLFQATRLAREGRAVNLGGGAISAALSLQSPLAQAWLLEVLPPMLSAAADGDPATAIPPPPAPLAE